MDILDMIPDANGNQVLPEKSGYTPLTKLHGEVVGYRMEPYHDVTVYADGYEDWFYIGE